MIRNANRNNNKSAGVRPEMGPIPTYLAGGELCRGCDLALLASMGPEYDLERHGFCIEEEVCHAHLFVCSGPVTPERRQSLQSLYARMPVPRYALAVGNCPISGGPLRDDWRVVGGVDRVIPHILYLPGCPPQPDEIMDILHLVREWVRDGQFWR